jgi:nucleoside-diphosphate-sugar epimerase
MKLLITGGAGFLGLHLANYYKKNKLGKNCELTLVDTADYKKSEYLGKFNFVKGDVRNSELMKTLISKNDYVIHAAAALPLAKKEEIFSTNIEGTKTILKNSKNVKKIIYISSTAVYGIPKKHPIVETDPLVGVGSYGISKIEAEKACQCFRNKDNINTTIIRPKTFIGTHRLGVFEILFDWIKDEKKIPVIGKGNNCYQLLDVDDLAQAIFLCCREKNIKKTNDVYHLGAQNFKTVNEMLQKLFDYANSNSKILPTHAQSIKIALFIFEKLRLSPLYQWIYDTADKDSFVSNDKIIKTLEWKPQYSNSQALIKSYQWYLDNYDFVKNKPSGIDHTSGWKQGILALFKKFM